MDEHDFKPTDFKDISYLKKLPILSKKEVKKNESDFLSTKYRKKDLCFDLTSGTTGTPLKIYKTKEALQFQWAVWWRHRARFGLKLGDRHLTFGARLPFPVDDNRPPYWRYNSAINQVYLSTYHIKPENIEVIVNWLNTEKLKFFTGYPSAMYVLAKLIIDSNLSLKNFPDYISTGSDILLPEFEKLIGEVFRAPVTDQYGMMEACGNFSRCEHENYHLDTEFGIVELIPMEGYKNLYRFVFTGLTNYAMPFIRYDIGDYGEMLNKECKCGRQSLAIRRIDGRIEDFVRTPDGKMAVGMNQVFEWSPGIFEAQIRQNSINEIDVLVVPSKEYKRRDEGIIINELRSRIGKEMIINYKVVEKIDRPNSGKLRLVISNLKPDSNAEDKIKLITNE
jgi:phenylacetate-CoA ligase